MSIVYVATTAARDALSPSVDQQIYNGETLRLERWTGSEWAVSTTTREPVEHALAYGAVASSYRVGAPAASSLHAINAAIYAAMAFVDEGKVSSASNNDSGWVTLTKVNQGATWDPTGAAGLQLRTVLRSGTASGAQSSTTLQDTTLSASGTDIYATAVIRLTGGPGAGQVRHIYSIAFGSGIINIDPKAPWASGQQPVAGSTTYEIIGTRSQTGGSYNDVGVAFDLVILSGPGKGYSGVIVAHDALKLTLDRPFDEVPTSDSRFRILPSALTAPPRFFDREVVLPGGALTLDLKDGWINALRNAYGGTMRGAGRGVTTLFARGGHPLGSCAGVTTTATTFTKSPSPNWGPDRWKNRYLVLWDPNRSRHDEIRITGNTADTLTLDQTAWPQLAAGEVTTAISATEFTDANLPNFGEDLYRFAACRFTSGGAGVNGEIREISGSHAGYSIQVATAYGAAPQVGNDYVLEVRPFPDWQFAIAEDVVLEINGVANMEFRGFTVEGESQGPSEILRLIGLTWRRPYDGSNRQNDFSTDLFRAARSCSETRFYDIEARNRWIIDAIKVGNWRKGGNFQIDITGWVNPKVVGSLEPSTPSHYTHWLSGMSFGSYVFGNNVIHTMENPYLTSSRYNVTQSYSGIYCKGGVLQSAWRNIYVNSVSDYCVFEGTRSEGSGGLVFSNQIGAKRMAAAFRNMSFKVDGPNYLAGTGGIVEWTLPGEVSVEGLIAEASNPAPISGSVATGSTSTTLKLDTATLSRSLAANELNGLGFVVCIVSGTGAAQYKTILSNSAADTLEISGSWSPTPANGSTFQITEAAFAPVEYTAAAGGTTTQIRLSGADLLPGIHEGHRVIVKTGALAGVNGPVWRNTRDRLYLDFNLGGVLAAGNVIVIARGRYSRIIAGAAGPVGNEVIVTAKNCGFIGTPIERLFAQPRSGGGSRTQAIAYHEMTRDGTHRLSGSWGHGARQTIDGWYRDNVGSGLTNQTLTRLGGPSYAPNAWIAPRKGFLLGVIVKASEARTAGTLTLKIFKNGTEVTGWTTAVLDGTNTTLGGTAITRYSAGFAAGDELDLRVTTDGSWAPGTADIRGFLEVEVDE